MWAAIAALINLLTIFFTRQNDERQQKIEQDVQSKKESDDLKEEMHRALISGDNSAIVACFNKYGKLRKEKSS